MDASTHAHVMEILHWVMLIVGVPVGLCLGLGSFSGTAEDIVPLIVYIVICIVIYLILWRLPVRCTAAGCNGSMQKTATEISTFRDRIQYRCTTCDNVYEADIFSPPGGDYSP
jgi:hypothetical protein